MIDIYGVFIANNHSLYILNKSRNSNDLKRKRDIKQKKFVFFFFILIISYIKYIYNQINNETSKTIKLFVVVIVVVAVVFYI